MKVTLSPGKIRVELLDSAEPLEAEVQLPHQISAEFLIRGSNPTLSSETEQVVPITESETAGEELPKPSPWTQSNPESEAPVPEDLASVATLECPEVTWEEFYEAVNTKPEEWKELFRIIDDQHPDHIANSGLLDQ